VTDNHKVPNLKILVTEHSVLNLSDFEVDQICKIHKHVFENWIGKGNIQIREKELSKVA
jgi:hypothetical protein